MYRYILVAMLGRIYALPGPTMLHHCPIVGPLSTFRIYAKPKLPLGKLPRSLQDLESRSALDG